MSGYNNSLLYLKHYYANNGINWDPATDKEKQGNEAIFKKINQQLFGAVFPKENHFPYPATLNVIELKTTYPGLLLGSGIAHGSGLLGEMKLGFFLDYTTGLPVIPGSSVKGVLRSAFPQGYRKAAKGAKEDEKPVLLEKAKQTAIYIQYNLKEITGKDWPKEAVETLEIFLFGSYETGSSDTAMTGRTVFHDAIPVNADGVAINGVQKKYYLGDDYITPHKNRKNNGIPDALVNPTPISFLKVLPSVAFHFQFLLHPFAAGDGEYGLSITDISQLFKNILTDFGIGAKTNVGYGRLTDPKAVEVVPKVEVPQAGGQRSAQSPQRSHSSSKVEDTQRSAPQAQFFKGALTHTKDLVIDAVVTLPGRPKNRVRLHLAADNMPEADMTGYASPLNEGAIVETYVRLKKNLEIESVRFKGFKK